MVRRNVRPSVMFALITILLSGTFFFANSYVLVCACIIAFLEMLENKRDGSKIHRALVIEHLTEGFFKV